MSINIFEEINNILNQYENIDNLNIEDIDINKLYSQNTFLDTIYRNIEITVSDNSNYTIFDNNNNNNNNNNNIEINNEIPIYDNESDIKIPKIDNDKIIEDFIRRYYKKIVIVSHPDKTDDIYKNKLFIKTKEYYENRLLIGIMKICYNLNIMIDDIDDIIVNRIYLEIRYIQHIISNIINNK